MRLLFQPMIGMFTALLMATAALLPSAQAQGSAVYLATYVEVMPTRWFPAVPCSSNIATRAPRKTAICATFACRNRAAEPFRRHRNLARQGGARSPRPKRGYSDVPRQAQADRGRALRRTHQQCALRRARQEREPVRRDLRSHPCRRDSRRQGRLHGGAQGDERRYRE